jgi:hypothetical protein
LTHLRGEDRKEQRKRPCVANETGQSDARLKQDNEMCTHATAE